MLSAPAYVSTFVSITRRMVSGARRGHDSDVVLREIRTAMVEQVLDCPPARTRSARAHINAAESTQQLWLLRGEVYQAISDQFGQHEAERRMALIEPLFPQQLRAPRSAFSRVKK
ncbi:hypothetical protein [Ottowia sp.]|uniref:hypothetical protein n=1 Tax=Ottowia sp. TaxID=1898956 RepID=UPI003A89C306